jgi:hypothetical protein
MQLTLRDRVFQIESATLSGGMWDPYWSNKYDYGAAPRLSLALELKFAPREHDEATWQPMLYHDSLSFPTRDWRDIAGQRLSWTSPLNEQTGEHNGCMYVFEHADIHEGELTFGDRTGVDFEVAWRGVCDIFWDESDYGRLVPFAATARARFSKVLLHGSAKDDVGSFRERFAQHLNLDDFDHGEIVRDGGTYDDGMPTSYCIFTPKAG